MTLWGRSDCEPTVYNGIGLRSLLEKLFDGVREVLETLAHASRPPESSFERIGDTTAGHPLAFHSCACPKALSLGRSPAGTSELPAQQHGGPSNAVSIETLSTPRARKL